MSAKFTHFQHAKLSVKFSSKACPKRDFCKLDGKKISDARLDGYHQSVPGDFHHTRKSKTGTCSMVIGNLFSIQNDRTFQHRIFLFFVNLSKRIGTKLLANLALSLCMPPQFCTDLKIPYQIQKIHSKFLLEDDGRKFFRWLFKNIKTILR